MRRNFFFLLFFETLFTFFQRYILEINLECVARLKSKDISYNISGLKEV